MVQKGQCLTCEYCVTRDDGYERQLVCTQKKRAKVLTWVMHTGEFDETGNFIRHSIEVLDNRLKEGMVNRVPPKSCHYRTKEKNDE